MIRTRDFLLFVLAFIFLTSGIGVTVMADIWNQGDQIATAVQFNDSTPPEGAESHRVTIPYEENAARLRGKIARGEGVEPGNPVFTSVDDFKPASDIPSVTDQTPPPAVLVGHTMDGRPLMSDGLWRFVGFSSADQVGVALNGYPIYGSRSDIHALDACGGIDEGFGYRYYLLPGETQQVSCLAST